jgi:hypothetical protein
MKGTTKISITTIVNEPSPEAPPSSTPQSAMLWTRDVQRCRNHQCPACRPRRRPVRFRSVSPPRPSLHSLPKKRFPRRWWDDSSPKKAIPEPAASPAYTFLSMCHDACLACQDEDPPAATGSSWTTEDLHPLNATTSRTRSSLEFW